MHIHQKIFRTFLIIYLVFLSYHISQIGSGTSFAIIGLGIGILIAVLVHRFRGYGTSILLVIHMTIEWIEYVAHGFHYSYTELAFYGLHTLLDFTFLWYEVKTYLPKSRYRVIGVFGCMAIIFFVAVQYGESLREHGVGLPHHEHGTGLVEMTVIGGILGCTLSHLFGKRTCDTRNLQ